MRREARKWLSTGVLVLSRQYRKVYDHYSSRLEVYIYDQIPNTGELRATEWRILSLRRRRRTDTYDAVDRQLQRQASLSHLIQVTTEARTQGTRAWIASHVKTSRRYWPPKDSGICPDLRMERKGVASRFFQLASEHAAIGSYLAEKTKTI